MSGEKVVVTLLEPAPTPTWPGLASRLRGAGPAYSSGVTLVLGGAGADQFPVLHLARGQTRLPGPPPDLAARQAIYNELARADLAGAASYNTNSLVMLGIRQSPLHSPHPHPVGIVNTFNFRQEMQDILHIVWRGVYG